MSGQKDVVARLSAGAEAQLATDLAQCRENAAELAATANLAGRAHALTEVVKTWLEHGTGSEGFRAKLESLAAGSAELDRVRAEIKTMLDDAGGSRGRTATPADAARVARVRGETTARLRAVGSLRGRLSSLIEEVESGLAAEDRAASGGRAHEGARRRAEVAGLLEEVEARMHPAAGATFAGVKRGASELRKTLSNLKKRAVPPTREEVEKARRDLGELVAKAEGQEQESRKQWEVYQRLDRTFRDAKFHRSGKVEMPSPGAPVLAVHATREAKVAASIESRVEANGSIHLMMRGGSESGSIVLPPDDACPHRLNEIARLAREHGLIIDKVLYKGPDGFHEMSLPGIGRSDVAGTRTTTNQTVEAKPE